MGVNASPRDVMPLDIGQFLLDTHHLTPVASFAYLHLKMHYWRYGPLPGDPESLAVIAQLSPDATSIAQVAAKHWLHAGADGLLHSPEMDILKASAITKHQKAHEKAQKAARARWDKERAKRGELKANHAHAPSNASVMREHEPSTASMNGSPPFPLEGSPLHPLPSTPISPLRLREVCALPEPHPPTRASDEPGASAAGNGHQPENRPPGVEPGASGHTQDGEKKAKTILRPLGAFAGGAVHQPPLRVASERAYPPQKNRAHCATNRVRPTLEGLSEDLRFSAFRDEISVYWRKQNPKHPNVPFGKLDEKALRDLLKDRPEMQLGDLKELLYKRSKSDCVNPSQLARHWLRHIDEFTAGPLDRSRKPARSVRSL